MDLLRSVDAEFKMEFTAIFLCILMKLCVCAENTVHHFTNSGTIDENASWYETKLTNNPALRLEVHMRLTFRKEICCPIVHLFADLDRRYDYVQKFYLGNEKCLSEKTTEGMVYWFKSSTFVLPDNIQNSGNCDLSQGIYHCDISTVILNYEPKIRWLTLGYKCNQKGNLSGFHYEYTVRAQNTTQCERIQIPENANDFYFQCNQFYNYVTFPNVFGHTSQTEVFAILQVFQTTMSNMDRACYKYLDYAMCQAFFPRCPNGTNEINKTATHLNVMCEQMCWEAVNACFASLQPVINFTDCSYYIKTSDIDCTYKQVTCNEPPSIPNGRIISNLNNNKTYNVGSTVTYSCDKDYKLQENSTSTCQYSGTWTNSTTCHSILYIKIIAISVSCGICLLLFVVVTIYHCKRKREMKRRAKYFENQPLEKRNKEKDAFLSFFGDQGADYDFVKSILQPTLEVKPVPPFKLIIHLRDFRADTLIYVNIRNAVVNSNSAIILMSQAYIDSRWCREEFEECVEENSKDPAYKLFVILMQPKETLKRYTAYMDKYFRSKTYLTKDDPQLWTKLTTYLKEVKNNAQ